jgi:hypothetical protein
MTIYLISRSGKLPALPGGSPMFDLYDGLCEFLISAMRKRIRNERVPESEPYEMGLQISRGVYTDQTYPKRSLRSRRKTADRIHDYRTSLLKLVPHG